MLSLLVTVVVICIVFGIFVLILNAAHLPEPYQRIAQLVLLLIFLLVMLYFLVPLIGAHPVLR